MQENKEEPPQRQHKLENELSKAWQELLGMEVEGVEEGMNQEQQGAIGVPLLASDPWQKLVQGKGNEELDLQKNHLHMSDQDVEQALQIMQEDEVQQRGAPLPEDRGKNTEENA
ncbi:hypothetical protein [Ktedonospora formicarum]|uniref:Uncharacterized protein n=1 Tax=Ktedonospora formicarum TaxID=2778364 RepID=A0A8J3I1D3_9CHLR|nr:hypothetical protein [Ktedonospora formicarum]GHO43729.1 hypothetical protein KSX_18920 [Ktedonospora formicarum]